MWVVKKLINPYLLIGHHLNINIKGREFTKVTCRIKQKALRAHKQRISKEREPKSKEQEGIIKLQAAKE
jgi:hypothetical protein